MLDKIVDVLISVASWIAGFVYHVALGIVSIMANMAAYVFILVAFMGVALAVHWIYERCKSLLSIIKRT